MNDLTDLGIFFIVGSILVVAFGPWVHYTDTHPKKK
jgi:hypothetical protein